MIDPKIPFNEKERLKALKSYEILDSESELIFDSLTKLAASICNVPICLISLVDENRQWFKSRHGLSTTETPREISFCGHAINNDDIFYIEDATKDERFFDNPLVVNAPNIVFYAGKPLRDNNGFTLGTLCVIDNKPRQLTILQKEQLEIIGQQVSFLIKSRIEIKKKDQTYSLLKKLSENLPGFIFTYQLLPDGSSSFPYSSHHIKEIYEVSSEEASQDASSVFSHIHTDDLEMVLASISESAKNMTKWSLYYRVNLPKSGIKWLRGNANPENSKDGSILWHGYITDITDQKKQEEIFNNSLKMATLGEMAAGIAHEINNPLAIIKTASQQMTSSLKRNDFNLEKFTKSIEKINQTTDRIAKIIRGISFFSTSSKDHQFMSESIYNIIDDTIALCSEKFKVNNVELRYNCPENIKNILIDCRAVEISQVLLNLFNNAFDAIEMLDPKWIELNIVNKEKSIMISVTDCGMGISQEQQEKILTPFYTTKSCGKGTGLGLSIIQKIIDSHGGKFWIDHECTNTRFVFEILKSYSSLRVEI